ncbi:MAG: hypothetical protein PVH65_12985, partial [Chloroflexota bacterium]
VETRSTGSNHPEFAAGNLGPVTLVAQNQGVKVTKKSESPKGQNKGEKTPHSQWEDVRESADSEYSAVDPLLVATSAIIPPDKLTAHS